MAIPIPLDNGNIVIHKGFLSMLYTKYGRKTDQYVK